MFGVCYYPEHWPQSCWQDDAEKMAKLGLKYVRIGEFAWSRIEPNPGEFDWQWMDLAITTLAAAGLKVVLGTPTATPPKWLIDQRPEILAVDINTGMPRGFGSRRHYDFSSDVYLQESLRISEQMAARYGEHPDVVGWQTDNELCCHDTAVSASAVALDKFQQWCERRYGNINALNLAWGNVFWSMEYRSFSEIELPFFTTTEANPAHQLAYRRFSSDRVVDWHEQMITVIRKHSVGQFVTHNFIPMPETGVDNFALAKNLDFACYDNYPLGRSDLFFADVPAEEFKRYMRTGHPDFATFYHDQTRALSLHGEENRRGNFWIMEQQPGPVNWAQHNPRPAPGMIYFWSLEAFAHGADVLCYFRWRQIPFAQEQMHAGLLRPDNSPSTAWPEIEQAVADIAKLDLESKQVNVAKIAIVTETQAQWVDQIERQGAAYEFTKVQMNYYSALRCLGVDIDFISQDHDLAPYQIIVVPCLPIVSDGFVQRCKLTDALIVFGPRAGAKSPEFAYPQQLPPGALQEIIPLKVFSVETLRPDCSGELQWQGRCYQSGIWREELSSEQCEVLASYEDETPAVMRYNNVIYIGCLTDQVFLQELFASLCLEKDIATLALAEGVRVRRRGDLLFAFNYSQQPVTLAVTGSAKLVIGADPIQPLQVAVWQE